MFCKNCGQQLKDGSVFCTSCGSKIDIAPSLYPEEATDYTPSAVPYPVSEAGYDAPVSPYPEEEAGYDATVAPYHEEEADYDAPVAPYHEEGSDYIAPYPEEEGDPDAAIIYSDGEIDSHAPETLDPDEPAHPSEQQTPSAITASNPNIVTLEPVPEKADVLVAQPIPRSGFTVFGKIVKAFFSVIFAIVTFALVCALTAIVMFQPANIPGLVADIDIAAILDEPDVSEAIEKWLDDPAYADLDVDYEGIKEYLTQEDLPDRIAGGLEAAIEDSVAPYLFLSVYPLIIVAALCALAIFDIFMIHRKTARLAFLTAGIPIAFSGLMYFGSGLIMNYFPGILWSRSLRTIAGFINGVSQLMFLYGLVVFAVGVVSIVLFFVLRAVRNSRRAKTPDSAEVVAARPTDVWHIVGIITNFTLLIGCAVVLFIYYLNIPWK